MELKINLNDPMSIAAAITSGLASAVDRSEDKAKALISIHKGYEIMYTTSVLSFIAIAGSDKTDEILRIMRKDLDNQLEEALEKVAEAGLTSPLSHKRDAVLDRLLNNDVKMEEKASQIESAMSGNNVMKDDDDTCEIEHTHTVKSKDLSNLTEQELEELEDRIACFRIDGERYNIPEMVKQLYNGLSHATEEQQVSAVLSLSASMLGTIFTRMIISSENKFTPDDADTILCDIIGELMQQCHNVSMKHHGKCNCYVCNPDEDSEREEAVPSNETIH